MNDFPHNFRPIFACDARHRIEGGVRFNGDLGADISQLSGHESGRRSRYRGTGAQPLVIERRIDHERRRNLCEALGACVRDHRTPLRDGAFSNAESGSNGAASREVAYDGGFKHA